MGGGVGASWGRPWHGPGVRRGWLSCTKLHRGERVGGGLERGSHACRLLLAPWHLARTAPYPPAAARPTPQLRASLEEGIRGEVEGLRAQLEGVKAELAPWEAQMAEVQARIDVAAAEADLLVKQAEDAMRRFEDAQARAWGWGPRGVEEKRARMRCIEERATAWLAARRCLPAAASAAALPCCLPCRPLPAAAPAPAPPAAAGVAACGAGERVQPRRADQGDGGVGGQVPVRAGWADEAGRLREARHGAGAGQEQQRSKAAAAAGKQLGVLLC